MNIETKLDPATKAINLRTIAWALCERAETRFWVKYPTNRDAPEHVYLAAFYYKLSTFLLLDRDAEAHKLLAQRLASGVDSVVDGDWAELTRRRIVHASLHPLPAGWED